MSVNIRLARNSDVPVLEKLFFEFSSWNLQREKSIREAVKDSNAELLVTEMNGRVIGFVHQIFYNDPLHAGLCSAIANLFVKEGFRGRGIASQLLQKALESAKKRNVIEVHVTTRKDNAVAIRLYEKLGFRSEGILLECNPE